MWGSFSTYSYSLCHRKCDDCLTFNLCDLSLILKGKRRWPLRTIKSCPPYHLQHLVRDFKIEPMHEIHCFGNGMEKVARRVILGHHPLDRHLSAYWDCTLPQNAQNSVLKLKLTCLDKYCCESGDISGVRKLLRDLLSVRQGIPKSVESHKMRSCILVLDQMTRRVLWENMFRCVGYEHAARTPSAGEKVETVKTNSEDVFVQTFPPRLFSSLLGFMIQQWIYIGIFLLPRMFTSIRNLLKEFVRLFCTRIEWYKPGAYLRLTTSLKCLESLVFLGAAENGGFVLVGFGLIASILFPEMNSFFGGLSSLSLRWNTPLWITESFGDMHSRNPTLSTT